MSGNSCGFVFLQILCIYFKFKLPPYKSQGKHIHLTLKHSESFVKRKVGISILLIHFVFMLKNSSKLRIILFQLQTVSWQHSEIFTLYFTFHPRYNYIRDVKCDAKIFFLYFSSINKAFIWESTHIFFLKYCMLEILRL